MEKIRLGNDIEMRWSIFTRDGDNRVPYDLEGRALTLSVVNRKGESEIEFFAEGNIVTGVFRGRDQKILGKHGVILRENNGEDGMRTVDACDAFELVACSCEEALGSPGTIQLFHLTFDTTIGAITGTIDPILNHEAEQAEAERKANEIVRKIHEEARQEAEAARQKASAEAVASANAAVENAQQKAEEATSSAASASSAASTANEAAGAANAAATSANEAATNADKKAELANEAAYRANTAADLAHDESANASSAALAANSAASDANSAAENAQQKAEAANEATISANNATEAANVAAGNAQQQAQAANEAAASANNAATAANAAAENAQQKADEANGAAVLANSAAEAADTAAGRANEAADKFSSAVVQQQGTATDKAMSQKAVTDALTASDEKLSELDERIQNTIEEGLYVCNEKGEVVTRLDILDSSELGENILSVISESAKENSLAPCAEEGFYICNEVGDVIAFYDNGWKFIESDPEIASRRKVYGIEINNADGSAKRYADAIGLNTNYVIGNVFVHDGSNDFDSIFPWCDMRLCNVKVINGIKQITYKGEKGFSRDGSNGDLMIEIPKFYTMRKCFGDREITCITGENKSGFIVEPAFHDSETGEEINYIYVAAYLSDISKGHHTSVTNAVPTTRASLLDFRQAGEMYDFVTLQALQKLFSIEFGTINTGEIFGGLSAFPLNYSAVAYDDATSTNTAIFWSVVSSSINPVDNFQVGQSIMIKTVGDSNVPVRRKILALGDVIEYTDSQGKKHRRSVTFSGEPVSIKASKMYGSSVTDYPAGTSECSLDVQENGLTDNLIYHTGRTAIGATTTTNQFKYRNIEGLWGNVGEMFDGARFKDLEYYIATKKADYANLENYRKLSYKGVAQTTYDAKRSVILRMGYDNRLPTINLPVAISADNTSVLIFGKYYGDILSSFNEQGKEYIGISSMAWDGDEGNGFYMYRFRETENGKSELYGTRMIYRNL